ncbi:hypothetical protein ACB092_04G065400 [Castanea dentata]
MFLSQFLCRSSHLLAVRHLLQAISISMARLVLIFSPKSKQSLSNGRICQAALELIWQCQLLKCNNLC